MVDINYIAILVSAIVFMVVGSLWYSPMLFAKEWMKLVGHTEKDMKDISKSKMNQLYGMMFIGALLQSYIMAHFVYFTKAVTSGDALQLGIWAWLGFYMLPTFSQYMFEGRPNKLLGINGGYQLIVFVVSALILTLWK